MRIFALVIILLALVPAGALGASGSVYRWTDALGVIHFADSPEKIPPQYRAVEEKPPASTDSENATSKGVTTEPAVQPEKQATVMKEPPEETKAKEEPAKAEAAPSVEAAPAPDVRLDNFGRDETWWRDRRKFWEQRLADSQRLYDETRREFSRVNQRYDSREYKQMKLLRERMKTLEGETAKAQEMLGGGLAREARKAGAPPGWVR